MIKVIETHHYDEDDCRESLKIEVFDGNERVKFISFYDGETEDNSIGRNFSDVHNITSLMKLAYEAGKAGKELVFEDGIPDED